MVRYSKDPVTFSRLPECSCYAPTWLTAVYFNNESRCSHLPGCKKKTPLGLPVSQDRPAGRRRHWPRSSALVHLSLCFHSGMAGGRKIIPESQSHQWPLRWHCKGS